MRAVAKAAGTTTPTVYERYRDREDILRSLRQQTRAELYAALSRKRTLRETIQRQLEFALEHPHAYEVLFDGVGKSPSLHEPWPSFNLMRERLAKKLGGNPRQHTRLMLSLWSLTHGASMLIIRGNFEGALRAQTIHACVDAIEAIIECARAKRIKTSGPRWPHNLVLGEGKLSSVGGNGDGRRKSRKSSQSRRPSSKSPGTLKRA
jgi:AcrR family transcriptional regulator